MSDQSSENDADEVSLEMSKFFRAVGRALTSWAWVGSSITSIFETCINFSAPTDGDGYYNYGQAKWIIHSVDGISLRLKMTDDLIRQSKVTDVDRAQWNFLFKKVNQTIKNRNKIAHWQSYNYHADGKDTVKLVPMQSTPKFHAIHSNGGGEITAEHLDVYRREFERLAEEIWELQLSIIRSGKIFDDQITELRQFLHDTGMDMDKICNFLRSPPAPDN
jgi:hypothetical protein